MKRALLLTVSAFLVATPVFAQSATERAASIKEWRANCSDPDPDLLVAYIEGAIESADRTIIRTCLRQALLGENEDVRNTALRGALAANNTLVLKWDMPKAYYDDIEKAAGDQETVERLNQSYDYKYHINAVERANGQMTFVSKNVSLSDKNSKWLTIWLNTTKRDTHFVDVNITGSTFAGRGKLAYDDGVVPNTSDFSILLELNDDGQVIGTGQIGKQPNFQVSVDLF